MPVQPGLIRPSGETQVISVKTSPRRPIAFGQMDEVEVARRAVDREYIAIGDTVCGSRRHLAQLERANIGAAVCPHARAGPEPALDAFEPILVAQAQVLVADPLASGEQGISELQRLEMQIALERLEPFGRIARAVLELEHFKAALCLIFEQRSVELERAVEDVGQLDRILDATWSPTRSRNARCARRRRAG